MAVITLDKETAPPSWAYFDAGADDESGEIQANGPIGLRLADGHGGVFHFMTNKNGVYEASADLQFNAGVDKKILLARGELFKIKTVGCTNGAEGSLVFYHSQEQ